MSKQPISKTWALTVSPCSIELETALNEYCFTSEICKWHKGCAEINGDSNIRHIHLASYWSVARSYGSVHKSFKKLLMESDDWISGKLSLKGVKLKVWYNMGWVDYPVGNTFGSIEDCPDLTDIFPEKGDTSFVKPKPVTWHDKVVALWDEHYGEDVRPVDNTDVKKFLSYIMYVTREIGVIERYKYNGRVVEIYEMLTMRNDLHLKAEVKVKKLGTIKDPNLTEKKNFCSCSGPRETKVDMVKRCIWCQACGLVMYKSA